MRMLAVTSGDFMDVWEHPTRIPAASNASDVAQILRVFKLNILSCIKHGLSRFGTKPVWPPMCLKVHHADELAVPPGFAFGFGCAGRRRLQSRGSGWAVCVSVDRLDGYFRDVETD